MLAAAFLLTVTPSESPAAPLKTYVAEFNVAGAANKDELKTTLQGLLTSRLNPELVQLVEKPENAEILLAGSYAQFGKMFSVDVLLKNSTTASMTKVFEQGESQDELIPAFGRLAQKLDREIAKFKSIQAIPAPAKPVPAPAPAPAAAIMVAPPLTYKVEAPAAAEESYVVKSGLPVQNTPGNWTSDPLNGVFSSITLGRSLPSGEREIFIAGEHSIRYLLKGSALKQVAEITIPVPAKVLAIDSADLDHDGIPEIYVSIIDRKTVSSRIYQPTTNGLELIAENQPWLYRGIGPDVKERTVFAQGVGSTGEYQSGVAELKKLGRAFTLQTPLTLPGQGNIFNFTSFRDAAGKQMWAVLDEDGYLIVSAGDGSELWKSSDKYSGSETNFNFETVAQLRGKGDKYRWNFLEQRMIALPNGTLILPRNEGTFSIGNNRSYNKHTLFGLEWNGALCKEVWHTRQTPSYLADYAFDTATREVVLLEVVQRAGLFGKGKAVITINKLD
jgi:hypothetical protein